MSDIPKASEIAGLVLAFLIILVALGAFRHYVFDTDIGYLLREAIFIAAIVAIAILRIVFPGFGNKIDTGFRY